MDNTKLDAILYLAVKHAGRPELDLYEKANDDYVPSKRFMRKMRRFINRVNRQEKWSEWRSVTAPLKRIAVAAMMICTIGLGCILSIQAVREAIWSTIVEWYEKSIAVMFVAEDDVSAPTEILEYKEPTAGLDGYERYEMDKSTFMYTIEYEKDNILIVYRQTLLGNTAVSVSNKETTIHETLVCGSAATYFEYNANEGIITALIWNDEHYQYSLDGALSLEELIVIAESVK